MYGYIYMTTNVLNGKRYIGHHRATKFETQYKGSGAILIKAFNKYGFENFSVELIEECYSEEKLLNREQYWIEFYNAVDDPMFYNRCDGGIGSKGFYNCLSDEEKELFKKKCDKWTGRKHTDEEKEKIRQKAIGRKYSEETKKKISLARRGKPTWKGQKMSEQGRMNIRKSIINKNSVGFIDLFKNNEFICRFNNQYEYYDYFQSRFSVSYDTLNCKLYNKNYKPRLNRLKFLNEYELVIIKPQSTIES